MITLGEAGMILLEDEKAPYPIPARALEVYDVSGAGDTAIALFTSALWAGFESRFSAEITNCGAGLVVGKLGTATLGPEELLQQLERLDSP